MDHGATVRLMTERLIEAAVRQGFTARLTERGHYVFGRGNITVVGRDPVDQFDWINLMRSLCQAGLEWPPPLEDDDHQDW